MLVRGIPTYTFDGLVNTGRKQVHVKCTYYGIDTGGDSGPDIEPISVTPGVIAPNDPRLIEAIRKEWREAEAVA